MNINYIFDLGCPNNNVEFDLLELKDDFGLLEKNWVLAFQCGAMSNSLT